MARQVGLALVLVIVGAAVSAAADQQTPVRWTIEKVSGPGTAGGYPVIEGVEHFELMHVTPETGTYCHHAHIAHDGKRFYATWSNHLCREDGPGQRVRYAMSSDGRTWTEPKDCFPPMGPIAERMPRGEKSRVLTSNGLHLIDGVVYAVAGVNDWPRLVLGNIAREIHPDGTLGPMFWLANDVPPSFEGFSFEIPGADDPRFADIARKIVDFRNVPENCPSWSFRPGGKRGDPYVVSTGNWESFGCPMEATDGHRLCEPTCYRRPGDNVAVRLFRDKNGSHRIYAAVYDDATKTWTTPRQTNIPDSPSRAVAGRLPNGSVYVVGNQVWGSFDKAKKRPHWSRDPLVLSVSSDGIIFDRAWTIRSQSPKLRYAKPKQGKGRGFQYPHATVVGRDLWVIYSIGKEDVAVSRVPLDTILSDL